MSSTMGALRQIRVTVRATEASALALPIAAVSVSSATVDFEVYRSFQRVAAYINPLIPSRVAAPNVMAMAARLAVFPH